MGQRHLGKHYIREWRQHRGYSLRKLAAMMEKAPGEQLTSHANLGRIETFEQPYTQEILEALADALQTEVADLLTVNPLKEGDVVDFTALLRGVSPMERQRAFAVVKTLLQSGTGGSKGFYQSEDFDERSQDVGRGSNSEQRSDLTRKR